ncbi:GNAT family N-acetyltransferase [Streptomyces lasiicapitis]|uniref:N-acetyltransferase domain-containing protein n=1 Tax=Streptomyces lasiicapitis TaxID=1923961 RepID=A0ABQ2MYC5_9ACTN|nr:GNAT family N-acetyltransferase [Streptomyces lasiicapitis]GGO60086.1 hypothetical protein GCM10012286_83170 [Streptomyces lasiicapitis]
MILVRAEDADLPRLLKFRTDSAAWLGERGIDQWAKPFPATSLLASIRRGEVYLAKPSPAEDAAATITLDRVADPRVWTPGEVAAADAMYVHKLTVDRPYAGTELGRRLLDWAGDHAARQGAAWLRLDAWSGNTRLHAYYEAAGFTHVRTSTVPGVVSGWAAQRPTRIDDGHGLVVHVPDEKRSA